MFLRWRSLSRMSNSASKPVRRTILLVLFILGVAQPQDAGSATLRGRILLSPDQRDKPAEVVLKQGRRSISRTVTDADNSYEFRDLAEGRYELSVQAGTESERQFVDLFCGSNSVSVVDINLNRSDPSIIFPFSIESRSTVDIVELRRDYPKDVLKDYEKAIWELSPGGNIGKAVMYLQRVVKKAPDFFSARTRLGMVYSNMACYPEAEREYVLAREINPRATQPLLNLAALYLEAADARLGDGRQYLDESIALLQEVTLRQPNSSIAYCLLGAIYLQKQSYEDAEENLQKALNLNQRLLTAHLFLANVYMRQKKWEEAIKHIDDYLFDSPLSPDRKKIRNLRREIEGNLTPAVPGK
jgi:tetratricopeptide (TPR) repeat protein